MTIYFVTSFENAACRKSGKILVRMYRQQYYDDCKIKSSYGRQFSINMTSNDDLYNRLNELCGDSDTKLLIITTSSYNTVLKCSYTITVKTVIDRLKLAYPTIVYVRDTMMCDPIYPLSVDTISGTQANGKVQITLAVSGNASGKVRIVWGSLANVDVVTIDPAKIKSATYEKTLPAGTYLVCATVV